ncbi:hypothetical protein KGM_205728 [Danaus plexippus plexippus]|uniref:Uncharacterized protein n=1 Tax=Danaus plexippus plexippus TaxID=278856 RepID=A0A212FDT7_DANPL|nr:hypothetical protein KGM_205728 [Danaus plexippus plexippus]
MCSQRAIVDNLECCIDDLVECFEDFIRKSLLIIFLGIGVVIGLLIYLLKMIAERSPITNNSIAGKIKYIKKYSLWTYYKILVKEFFIMFNFVNSWLEMFFST